MAKNKEPRKVGRPMEGNAPKETLTITLSVEDYAWIQQARLDWSKSASWIVTAGLACLRKHPEDWPK